MVLEPGLRFGSYEVVGQIGTGGMGEVYRATDTTLKRDVALKVLPQAFVEDVDRLARFQREAEILASLNHPNIATIFGLERSSDQTVIVMELVDGPTLDDRIREGPIAPDEALEIVRQVANALEAAHERQIVHRDLKPANIKLRSDGVVKVLDFGISKVIVADEISGPRAASLTTPAATETGVILGTAAYMAPEQVRGLPIDQRTDIWAFGCVLYEMLTGQPAFGGDDVSTTLARILEREPDTSSLAASITPAAQQAIRMCLQKRPSQRLADIRDVKLVLEGDLISSPAAVVASGRRGRVWSLAAGLVAGALIAGTVAWITQPTPASRPVVSFEVPLPVGQNLAKGGFGSLLSLAQDGSALVFNADGGLYTRSMDTVGVRLIRGTQRLLAQPIMSSNGESVVFTPAEGSITVTSVDGELSFPISGNLTGLFEGGSWGHDGRLYLGSDAGIWRVHPTEGSLELVIQSAEDELLWDPQLLPDGDTVLFGVSDISGPRNSRIEAESISTGERKLIVSRGSSPRYAPTGHLLYVIRNTLWGTAFDIENLTPKGQSVPLIQGLLRPDNDVSVNFGNYAIADNGMLAYAAGDWSALATSLFWVDRNGNETPVGVEPREWVYAQVSPDDSRIALDARDQDNDVFIWDFEGEYLNQITHGPRAEGVPLWSPEGDYVIYQQDGEIFRRRADGQGEALQLTMNSPTPVQPSAVTPDGSAVLYHPSGPDRDIWIAPISDSPLEGQVLIEEDDDVQAPVVSPDGRWIAYESYESGQPEIVVRSFPNVNTGIRVPVSRAGGVKPQWSPAGTELFYLEPGEPGRVAMMAVSYRSEPTFVPQPPRRLFADNYPRPVAGRQIYSVSADGQRFLLYRNVTVEGDARPRVIVVENWLEELRRRVPTQ